jgi:hypothetical protein
MQLQKRHIVTFLFSIYFALYVLSPICYTEDGLSGNNAAAYQTNLNLKGIRIIWELILSKHLTNKDAERSQPNVQFLIKKARALVVSNSIVNLTPSESAEFDYNDSIFSSNFYTPIDHHTKPEYRTGSYLSVSGISPPSFS